MIFQRLLREGREKADEGRRADVILEQIKDLKAAIVESTEAGSRRGLVRSVINFRRLVDFLLALREVRPGPDILSFSGPFQDLLQAFGIVQVYELTFFILRGFTLLKQDDGTVLCVNIQKDASINFTWSGACSRSRTGIPRKRY